MESGQKKTNGIVTHVTERFGFIELSNKNIPISNVYFDFTSFQGSGSDLSKIFPKGTLVRFTFINSKGEHKVKHRAINLTKIHPQAAQDSERLKSGTGQHQGPHSRPRKHKAGGQEQNWKSGSQAKPENNCSSSYPHQQLYRSAKASNPWAGNQRTHRQNSQEAASSQGFDVGSIYPHDVIGVPPVGAVGPSLGEMTREAVAFGLSHLASKLAPQIIDSPGQSGAVSALLNVENLNLNEGNKKKGKNDRNRQLRQKASSARAFSDVDKEVEHKVPLLCSQDSEVTPQHVQAGSDASQKLPQLRPEQGKQNSRKRQKDKRFGNPEVKTFFELLGKDLSQAVKSKITALGLKSVNALLLLRIAVGKQPSMRIYRDGETANHLIDDAKTAEIDDLQRILRHGDSVKTTTPCHYGVKGTLHAIRSIEQNGKLTALSVFFQLHEPHDGLGLDIIERKRFTAVAANLETCPRKYLFNYLRCESQKMAKNKDVLVLDVEGQLTGSDVNAHPCLGDVSRINCSSASELPAKIASAVEHLHECVIAVGVDSAAALQALQRMTTKGVRVIAEIDADLKAEAELFSG